MPARRGKSHLDSRTRGQPSFEKCGHSVSVVVECSRASERERKVGALMTHLTFKPSVQRRAGAQLFRSFCIGIPGRLPRRKITGFFTHAHRRRWWRWRSDGCVCGQLKFTHSYPLGRRWPWIGIVNAGLHLSLSLSLL